MEFVVNCFQNCIFTYDSQHCACYCGGTQRCELLSELYFYLWFPTVSWKATNLNKLWIAFRIVFLLMIPNRWLLNKVSCFVVNCFQNCIFTYDSQHLQNCLVIEARCELLSELYFYLWFPTFNCNYFDVFLLWIAFRIVFLLMIPNNSIKKQ